MRPPLTRLLESLRSNDASTADAIFPASRRAELFSAIIAIDATTVAATARRSFDEPRRSRRRPTLGLRTLSAAALIACALAAAGVWLASSPQQAAPTTTVGHHGGGVIKTLPVSFRTTESGSIVATVTDPFAAQTALNAAFKSAGLNIVVTLVPVSPGLVGTVTSISTANEPGGGIQTLGQGPCVTGGGGCPIGITVPRDFVGQGQITLGRPAWPGEAYVGVTSAFAPGETLHCSPILNEQVATVLPQIAAANITPKWWSGAGPFTGSDTQSPNDYYIVDATPVSPGVVSFRTQATPLTATQLAAFNAQYSQGC
jgi:hypothetical protein